MPFKIINFLIFISLLTVFCRRPLRRFLWARAERISGSIHHAKKAFDAAQSEEKKWNNAVKNEAADKINLIEEFKKEALFEKEKILKQAHNYSELLKKNAAVAAEQEGVKTIAEIKRSIINSAIGLVIKRLSKEMTDKDHSSSIDAAIDRISSNL